MLLPADQEEAEQLWRRFRRTLLWAVPAAALVFYLGGRAARPTLRIWHATIVGSHHVAAGDYIRLRTVAEVPNGCRAGLTFWIEFPPDALSVVPPPFSPPLGWFGREARRLFGIKGPPAPREVINQPVSDTSIPFNGGDNLLQTNIHSRQGQGSLYGLLSTQGCGAFSGILKAQNAQLGPIAIWIDPPMPLPAAIKSPIPLPVSPTPGTRLPWGPP